MANLNNFDATQVEPTTTFEPIPAGKYVAAIVGSEMKPTKNGTGRFLELKFEILEGEAQGRCLWTRLNLENPNATAVKMAQSDLSAICRAVGVLTPRDSVDLHSLPLVIVVKCKKRTDNDEITNEIKGYEKKPAGPAKSDARTESTPPWKR